MRVNSAVSCWLPTSRAEADARKELRRRPGRAGPVAWLTMPTPGSRATGRRFLNEFRALTREWIDRRRRSDVAGGGGPPGRGIRAVARSGGGDRRQAQQDVERMDPVQRERWRRTRARPRWTPSRSARRNMFIAVGCALALSGILGFLTFRRIVHSDPRASDLGRVDRGWRLREGGSLHEGHRRDRSSWPGRWTCSSRGAAAMEEQRWVKTNAAKLTGELQGATSLAEFGQRLLSGLVPVLGGGVAGFYTARNRPGAHAANRRLWPGR